MLLYNVTYYTANGVKCASGDSDVGSDYVFNVCRKFKNYAKMENSNCDGKITRLDMNGDVISEFPWEIAERAREQRQSEIEKHRAAEKRAAARRALAKNQNIKVEGASGVWRLEKGADKWIVVADVYIQRGDGSWQMVTNGGTRVSVSDVLSIADHGLDTIPAAGEALFRAIADVLRGDAGFIA